MNNNDKGNDLISIFTIYIFQAVSKYGINVKII